MNMDVFQLTGRETVILDLETTGLDPEHDRVIEIAAIRWDHYGRQAYRAVVNPGVAVPARISRLTGLSQAEVEQGLPPAPALFQLYQDYLIDDPLIVAHHALFDLAFLDAESRRLGLPAWDGDFVCTCTLARFLLNRTGYSLPEVCVALGIPLPGTAHHATCDAEACERVLLALWPRAIAAHRPLLNAAAQLPGSPPSYRPPRAILYPFGG